MDCGSLLPLLLSQPAGDLSDRHSLTPSAPAHAGAANVTILWDVRRQQAAYRKAAAGCRSPGQTTSSSVRCELKRSAYTRVKAAPKKRI